MSTLQIPALGRQVRLGELYNQRTGKFLGVSLYSDAVGQRMDTPSSTVGINKSTTHQDRAALFNLHPQVSLGVFGGLVEVSGSAQYLHFHKAEETTSMSLKLITREERLPITNTPVLSADQEATHFVSSLTYGAFLIAAFSARKSKERASKGDIEGMVKKLLDTVHEGIEFNNELETMEEHLEFIFYSDLKDAPLNLRDLVDTFRNTPVRIGDGGVVISATLQPIRTDSEGYLIPTMLASDLSEVFIQLADLRHRFSVLKDHTRNLRNIAPKLEQKVMSISGRYTEARDSLLGKLAASVERHGSQVLTDVHSEAMSLCNRYLERNGQETERQCPSTLTGLEEQLSLLERFCANVDDVCKTLLAACADADVGIHGSNAADFFQALRKHVEVLVFIMPPLLGDLPQDYSCILTYARILQAYPSYCRDIERPPYLMYVEDLDDLTQEFAGYTLPSLLDPSLFIVRFDEESNKLTWDRLRGTPDTPGPERTSMQTDAHGHRNWSWYSKILSRSYLGKRARLSPATDASSGAPLAATFSSAPINDPSF